LRKFSQFNGKFPARSCIVWRKDKFLRKIMEEDEEFEVEIIYLKEDEVTPEMRQNWAWFLRKVLKI
jgi:hypothetical protein